MSDAVDRLASLVADLTTQQNLRMAAMEERLIRAEERQAKGLEGFGRLGDKVGALAEAMKENMAETAKARERIVADQKERLAEFRRLAPLAADGAGAHEFIGPAEDETAPTKPRAELISPMHHPADSQTTGDE